MIGWLAVAHATDLPALAERDGYAAAHAAVQGIVGGAKGRKLDKALALARLAEVQMPVRPFRGAELVVTQASPATGCRWADGLVCAMTLATSAQVQPGELEVTCRSSLGALLKVQSRLVSATPTEAVLEVSGMGPCWDLGDELLVHPAAATDLEGAGEGNDLVPPELTGLTRKQVEDEITSKLPLFKHCLVSAGAVGLTGKLVVAYEIGPDGAIRSAAPETSTVPDPAVEACVLERFRALTFPPPNGGWDRGTYPFTFQ